MFLIQRCPNFSSTIYTGVLISVPEVSSFQVVRIEDTEVSSFQGVEIDYILGSDNLIGSEKSLLKCSEHRNIFMILWIKALVQVSFFVKQNNSHICTRVEM